MKPTRSKTDSYRSRFGLTHHPLPRDASGRTFFDQTAGYQRLEMCFQDLSSEPGLRCDPRRPICRRRQDRPSANLCAQLPEPDFKTLYLCEHRGLALRPVPHPRPRAGSETVPSACSALVAT